MQRMIFRPCSQVHCGYGCGNQPQEREDKKMKEVVRILMERDGLTRKEAENHYKNTMRLVNKYICAGEYFKAEDTWLDEMGLEIDYLLGELI